MVDLVLSIAYCGWAEVLQRNFTKDASWSHFSWNNLYSDFLFHFKTSFTAANKSLDLFVCHYMLEGRERRFSSLSAFDSTADILVAG